MAFPTTSLIDDFNRANESPLSNGGKWTCPAVPGDSNAKVDTNEATNTGSNWCSAYWSNATFGGDCEVYCLYSTKGTSLELLLRLASPGTTGIDGYLLDVTGSTWSIWRIDNNAQTQIGTNATQAIASGDSVGFEAVGSTLNAYIKTGGTWTLVKSVSDATYSAAGNIGFTTFGASARIDNFSGGTIAGGGTLTLAPATINGSSAVSATLAMIPKRIAPATINGLSTVSAVLSMIPKRITPGTITCSSTVTAALKMVPKAITAATINGRSTVSAVLTGISGAVQQMLRSLMRLGV